MPARRATRAERKRHEEAADWILRNRNAGQAAADKAAFRQWLGGDPDNRRVYAAAERLMGEARIAIESDPALRDFEVKPRNAAKPIVGSLLVLLLAGSLFMMLDGPMRLRADVIARTGEMPLITLEDGSSVQLNASSALAHDFDGSVRTVRLLRGQAYFDVAPDPGRPFRVEAGDVRITALGTAFDVRLGDTETDVTVTHSAVQVDIADAENTSIRISEGEQAIYDPATRASAVRQADGMMAVAWRRGQLVVDNAPLSYVVEEMRRHFYGRIVIATSELAQRRVSGTMAVANTDAALAFLEQALGIRTNHVGPLIVIRN